MIVVVVLPNGAQVEEALEPLSTWSTLDLRTAIEHAASERLNYAVVALLYFNCGGEKVPTDPPQSLSALGLHGGASIHCELIISPHVTRCEPPYGPVAGGTLVCIRGSGFLTQSGFASDGHSGARLSFGSGCSVPCWRASDEELLCRTPEHAEGVVSVTLLGCEAASASLGTAAFEFASEGRMCDLIFATTNAHCPLKGTPARDEVTGREASS